MTEIEIETEETTYTAKQLARKAGTDPKTLRKFLRSTASPVEAVGQGGRYEFDDDAAQKIIASFKTWNGVKTTKLKSETESLVDAVDAAIEELDEPAPKPKRKPRAKKTTEPVIIDDAVEELEELVEDEAEPTAEDLEELDDLFEDLDD